MLKVAIHGANGKLGSKIVALVKKSKNLSFAGSVDDNGIPVCDVVVDVTSDKGVASLLPRLTKQKLVVGATGNLPYKQLQNYAKKTAVFVVPNFSEGIQMLYPVIEQILEKTGKDWKFEIEETHHIHKKDKPSGTAKSLAKVFKNKKIKISSIRTGEAVGTHKIIFTNKFEKIELIHEAFSRDLYAAGCIKMIQDISHKTKGYFTF